MPRCAAFNTTMSHAAAAIAASPLRCQNSRSNSRSGSWACAKRVITTGSAITIIIRRFPTVQELNLRVTRSMAKRPMTITASRNQPAAAAGVMRAGAENAIKLLILNWRREWDSERRAVLKTRKLLKTQFVAVVRVAGFAVPSYKIPYRVSASVGHDTRRRQRCRVQGN